ncbi:lipoprotein [Clostridia bacterium]|nr:lipoprotein [Clostridia bacterium]
MKTNNLRKILTLILSAATMIALVTGCADSGTNTTNSDGGTVAAGESPTKTPDKVLVKLASRDERPEVWDAVNKILAADNIVVENKAYDTSVNLNDLLIDGDIDLNVAQHYAAIQLYKNASEKYNVLRALGDIAISTIDLYSNKYKSIDELPSGATIAIPNDQSNGGRALLVLEAAGVIKLAADHDPLPLVEQIAENPKNLQFKDISSDIMIRILDDVDAGFAYSGNAVDGGFNPLTDPLAQDVVINTAFG